MRRPLVLALVGAALASAATVTAVPSGATTAPDPREPRHGATSAQRALSTVQGLLADVPSTTRRATAARPEVSLAMRDLFLALPRLDATDRRTARHLLARPTDGASDPLGDGYAVPARKSCRGHVCVHWVDSTADAPPSRAWVRTILRALNSV